MYAESVANRPNIVIIKFASIGNFSLQSFIQLSFNLLHINFIYLLYILLFYIRNRNGERERERDGERERWREASSRYQLIRMQFAWLIMSIEMAIATEYAYRHTTHSTDRTAQGLYLQCGHKFKRAAYDKMIMGYYMHGIGNSDSLYELWIKRI